MQDTRFERNERQQELAALARLIGYARQSAEHMGAETITKSLTVALTALLDEAGEPGLSEALLASEPRQAVS